MENDKEWIAKPHPETAEGVESTQQQESAQPGAETAGSGPATQIPASLAEACEKLLADNKDLYDRLLRKQAELENLRKRTQREKEEFRQLATEDLIRSLLPTLDGFERALNHRTPSIPESFYEGMELIYRGLRDVLGRAGLAPIETVGKLFDPHLHQAVETVEAPGHRDQEIVEELQRGYKLKHRLLRPSIVKVALGSRRRESPEPAKGTANAD